MSERQLDVLYKAEKVGTLKETPDKRIAFQYDRSWLTNGFSISPFSLPLKADVFVPEKRTFDGLFGVFADSLPDAWGQVLLERFLIGKGLSVDNLNMLDRLAYVGAAGMGALEYKPARESEYSFGGYDFDELARECEKILDSQPSEKLDLLYHLGGSSGGTRPKVLVNEDGEEWIVKFPSSRDPKNIGKMEYDYSVCAEDCGIRMPQTELVPSNICEGYFKTLRFDRVKNQDGSISKIFSITAAGLLEADYRIPSLDYKDLLKLTTILTRDDKKQVEQMFRIMCFNVFAHNYDDHAKNFSFLCENGKWRLAPAYDLTYSSTYYGEHTTSVCGKGIDIGDEDLLTAGRGAGLSRNNCKNIVAEIKEKVMSGLEQYLRCS